MVTVEPVAKRPHARRRELTPAQHASIRRQLALIPLYFWVVYGWWSFAAQLPFTGAQATNVRDFAHFYVQGVIAATGDAAALYDIDAHAATLARVVPGGDVRYPPVYGPQVAVFFRPLAALPYGQALYVWLAFTAAVYALGALALWRQLPRLRSSPWIASLLFLGAPPFHFVLGFSQAAIIGFAAITLTVLALRGGHQFAAGLALGILAYKPPLGLAIGAVLLLAREWRVIAGAACSAAAQLAVGVAFWGAGIFGAYATALTKLPEVAPAMEPFKFQMHSWRAFFQLMAWPEALVPAATALASLVTVAVAFMCWRARADAAPRFATLVIATLLVDPHLYVYDLLLLVPVFAWLWDWAGRLDGSLAGLLPRVASSFAGRWRTRAIVQALLYAAYFAPLIGSIALVTRVQLSVPAMFALMCASAVICLRPQTVADTQSRAAA
jgi:alpha-1,2-mannosyltransferase